MSEVLDILESLQAAFLEEMPAHIDDIEQEVMASNESDTFDELFRMVHSLKGSAGSYNFHILTKIAHGMEDVMLRLMQDKKFGSAETLDILLKFIDVLRDTSASLAESNVIPLDVDERLDVLRDMVFVESLNILVVEPSKLYVNMIQYSLKDLPVNLTLTLDGFEALNLLLLHKYDLLITSLECPRLNGDALVAALRLLHNVNKDIKVILVTSRSADKITNKNYYDSILDRTIIKEGGLAKITKNIITSLDMPQS